MFEYNCEIKANIGYTVIKFLSETKLSEQEVRSYLLNTVGLGVDSLLSLNYYEQYLGKWEINYE